MTEEHPGAARPPEHLESVSSSRSRSGHLEGALASAAAGSLSRHDVLALFLVLAATLLVRAATWALPRDRGDELLWAGVPENVAARGPTGYTVRGIDYVYEDLGGGATLVHFGPAAVGSGMLLDNYVRQGERYWDSPLYNQPPAFVGALLASHALLGSERDGFPLVASDPRRVEAARQELTRAAQAQAAELARRLDLTPEERAARGHELESATVDEIARYQSSLATAIVAARPTSGPRAGLWAILPEPWRFLTGTTGVPGAARAQLWAVLPGVLGDLMTVALLFGIGRASGGRAVGVVAALAFACDPLGLYCGHRLLSNGPLAAACLATLALEPVALAARGARRLRLSIAVGLFAAVAISIKVSAVFLLPALVAARWLGRDGLDRSLVALLGAALAPVVPWWLLQWRVFGNPFGMPFYNDPEWEKLSAWARLLHSRGVLYYAQSSSHSPLVLVGGVVALGRIAAALRERLFGASAATLSPGASDGALRRASAAPGSVAAALFTVATIAAALRYREKEARHLLLVYPPLILEASRVLVGAARGQRRGVATLGVIWLAVLFLWESTAGLRLAFDVARVP